MIHHLSQTLSNMANTLNAMVNSSAIGNVLLGIGSVIVSYYVPIWYLFVICFAATFVDMYYGIKVAKKFKKKIESGKNWGGTIRKIRDEGIILSLLHGLEWAVVDESGVFLLTGGGAVIIALTEIWSIIENLNTLDPKGPWRILGKFLRKKGEDYIGLNINFEDEHDNDTVVDKEQLEESR